jgi:hypothetical protein
MGATVAMPSSTNHKKLHSFKTQAQRKQKFKMKLYHINSLTYHELQWKCKLLGLPATRKSMSLKQQLHEHSFSLKTATAELLLPLKAMGTIDNVTCSESKSGKGSNGKGVKGLSKELPFAPVIIGSSKDILCAPPSC